MKAKHAMLPGAMAALALGALTIPALASPQGHMSWSGSVDQTAIVSLHGDRITTDTVDGHATTDINDQVSGRLPRHPSNVFLQDVRGRGDIRVVQQPDFRNDFTARVRINDPQSGRSHYHFVLAWGPGDAGPVPAPHFVRPGRPFFRHNAGF